MDRRPTAIIRTVITVFALVSILAGPACVQQQPSALDPTIIAALMLSGSFQFEPPVQHPEFTVMSGKSRSGATDITIEAAPDRYIGITIQAPAASGPSLSAADEKIYQDTLGTLMPGNEMWLTDSLASLGQEAIVPEDFGDRSIFLQHYENTIILQVNTSWSRPWE